MQPKKVAKFANDMKSVITADIVGSTKIPAENRDRLPALIYELADELQVVSPLKVEIFRGDSFQVLVQRPEEALRVAILFRAGLRKSRLLEKGSIDARMAVGIGEVSYDAEQLSLSDGQAFVFSGREFDELKKRRLSVVTPNEEYNAELLVSTSMIDDIVSHWSRSQSECVYLSLLTGEKQDDLAKTLNTQRQNVGKKLKAAKEQLCKLYLKRVANLISRL